MSSRRLMIAAAAVTLLSANMATAVDKQIDKRTYSDKTGNRYFVVFCARGGSATGHAYVSWGMQDNQRRQSVQLGYGFYPVPGNAGGVFGTVPGELQNEAFNPRSQLFTDRLIVEVNREVYVASQQPINRWATNNFNLWTINCISFDIDVAGRVGLRVPPKGTFTIPSSYLQSLIRSN